MSFEAQSLSLHGQEVLEVFKNCKFKNLQFNYSYEKLHLVEQIMLKDAKWISRGD